jgi:murein L,D-transpeptidase YafK
MGMDVRRNGRSPRGARSARLLLLSFFLGLVGLAALSTRVASAAGPRVTEVRIDKARHTLTLRSGEADLATYRVAIGMGGAGPKRMEGDKVTPVGTYRVTGRIKGLFHKFLVLDYPNADDIRRHAELRARGEIPRGRGVGHGIGIHGVGGPSQGHKDTDWTFGCIALDDAEIDEIARRVPDGTPVRIFD